MRFRIALSCIPSAAPWDVGLVSEPTLSQSGRRDASSGRAAPACGTWRTCGRTARAHKVLGEPQTVLHSSHRPSFTVSATDNGTTPRESTFYPQILRRSREFLVAGELLRRGIMAAVTYGNAKKADVVAIHEGRSATIEVKTTSESRWVLGNALPPEGASRWVLVHLPTDLTQSPEYFVLTGTELRGAVQPRHDAYNAAYMAKHGEPYSKLGV